MTRYRVMFKQTPTNSNPAEVMLVETADRVDAFIFVAAELVEAGRKVAVAPFNMRDLNLSPEEQRRIIDANIPAAQMPYTVILSIEEWNPVQKPAGRRLDS